MTSQPPFPPCKPGPGAGLEAGFVKPFAGSDSRGTTLEDVAFLRYTVGDDRAGAITAGEIHI